MPRAIQLHSGMAFFETHDEFLLNASMTGFIKRSPNRQAPIESTCAGDHGGSFAWRVMEPSQLYFPLVIFLKKYIFLSSQLFLVDFVAFNTF